MTEPAQPTAGAAAPPVERSRPLPRNPWLWAFFAGIVMITLMRPLLRREPAPPPHLGSVPAFQLVDARARPYGSRELTGRVWVAHFFFARCTSICPLTTAAVAQLQERFAEADADVHIVGVTVDPDHDDPAVLREWGTSHGVQAERWTLLTGQREEVVRLVRDGLKLDVGEPPTEEVLLVDVAHSGKLVLVDGQGAIRGYYDTDALGVDETFHRALQVLREGGR